MAKQPEKFFLLLLTRGYELRKKIVKTLLKKTQKYYIFMSNGKINVH